MPMCGFSGVVPNCGRNCPIARLTDHKPKQSRPSDRKAIEWRRMNVVVCVGPDGQKNITIVGWADGTPQGKHMEAQPPPHNIFVTDRTHTPKQLLFCLGGCLREAFGMPWLVAKPLFGTESGMTLPNHDLLNGVFGFGSTSGNRI